MQSVNSGSKIAPYCLCFRQVLGYWPSRPTQHSNYNVLCLLHSPNNGDKYKQNSHGNVVSRDGSSLGVEQRKTFNREAPQRFWSAGRL